MHGGVEERAAEKCSVFRFGFTIAMVPGPPPRKVKFSFLHLILKTLDIFSTILPKEAPKWLSADFGGRIFLSRARSIFAPRQTLMPRTAPLPRKAGCPPPPAGPPHPHLGRTPQASLGRGWRKRQGGCCPKKPARAALPVVVMARTAWAGPTVTVPPTRVSPPEIH